MRLAHALALAGSLAALAPAAGCAHRGAPQEEAVEVQGRIVTDPAPQAEGAEKPCARAEGPRDGGGAPGCRCGRRPAE
ncbi:MAG TPA: hypothetical protein VEB43_13175 [Anaeromyxobacter sp.]|nr:hypothetical protein [Anaeromyxobacter sp.]